MRLLTSTIPVLLSSAVVLGHLHAQAHPARHGKMIEKRQRGSDSEGGLLGGILAGDENDASNSTTAVTTPIRSSIATTSVIATSSAVRSTPLPSSDVDGDEITSSAISSIGISSTGVSTGANSTASRSSLSPSESIASASSASAASITSAPPSSTASSTAAESQAVTTVTTDPAGEVKVITKILTASVSAASDGAASSGAAAKSDDGGISTGAIIGISVAAGVVVLALVICAIWRMKRRGGDEDEAIRWPELNRHGDSDVHHALPARQTGQHGFETGLERSLSNSSSVFTPSTHGPHSAAPMALNGSNFGAGSSLDGYELDEKAVAPPLPPLPGQHPHSPYDLEEDYTNMPPAVQMQQAPSVHAYGGYDSEEEGRPPMPGQVHSHDGQMGMVQGGAPASYYHPHQGH